jgi:hypothetical protein
MPISIRITPPSPILPGTPVELSGDAVEPDIGTHEAPTLESVTYRIDGGAPQPLRHNPPGTGRSKTSVSFGQSLGVLADGNHVITVAVAFSVGTLEASAAITVAEPYAVSFAEFVDSTGAISWPAVIGGVWEPPPPGGSTPGAPSFSGAVSSAPDQSATLTFPTLAGPPTIASAMLISQPSFGDLYRLAVTPPPVNPGELNGGAEAIPVITQAELDTTTSQFSSVTIAVPSAVQRVFALLTLGLTVPTSATLSAVTLTLPAAGKSGFLILTATGTLAVSGWFWTGNRRFTFIETVALAPSGDPVDTPRVLAATGSSPSLNVTGGWKILPVKRLVASLVTPAVESALNQALPPKVAKMLANNTPPQMLAPQAVISAGKITITHNGIAAILSIADIFGPALLPLPPVSIMGVSAVLVESSGSDRTIRVTVSDATTSAPVPGALVKVFNATSSREKAAGTTSQDGIVTLTYPGCFETTDSGPPTVEEPCQGTVSKQGYQNKTFVTPTG